MLCQRSKMNAKLPNCHRTQRMKCVSLVFVVGSITYSRGEIAMRKIIAATAAIGLSVMFGVSAQAQLPPGFKKQELTKISDAV